MLNGLSFGAVLFLLAAGLSLILGLMGVLNLAHGALFLFGAYLGVYLARGGMPFIVAALGGGGANPQYQPLPFDIVKDQFKPVLRLLLAFGEQNGLVSFEPYTQSAIERNLTDVSDFAIQYLRVVQRLRRAEGIASDIFLLTLPYYSSVGYLIDSEDLEFYLQKIDPMNWVY